MQDEDPPLMSSDQILKVAVVGVFVLAAGLGWWFRPRATLAADGRSPYWDAAVEQNRAEHRPALVLFTADWCPSCRALHADVLTDPAVQNEIAGHYSFLTVDLTAQSPACVARAQKYGVSGIPALIRFDADGKESDRTHYIPPAKMVEWLRAGE